MYGLNNYYVYVNIGRTALINNVKHFIQLFKYEVIKLG